MSREPPSRTLFDVVTFPLEFERRKHDKPVDHTDREINRLTNIELLQRISDALEEMKGT